MPKIKEPTNSQLGCGIIIFGGLWIFGTFLAGLLLGENPIIPALALGGWIILMSAIVYWLVGYFKPPTKK